MCVTTVKKGEVDRTGFGRRNPHKTMAYLID